MGELVIHTERAMVYLAGDPTPIRTTLTDVEVASRLAEGAQAAHGQRQDSDEYFVSLPLRWEGLVARVRPRCVSAILPLLDV